MPVGQLLVGVSEPEDLRLIVGPAGYLNRQR